jgi:hypothetical protein
MWYAITKRPRPPGFLRQEICVVSFALLVVVPTTWMASDRTPPVWRVGGEMDPSTVVRGGETRVRFKVLRRTRQDCPGTVQQEIVDSQNTIFSKLARATGPSRYEPDPWGDKNYEILVGQKVTIPEQAAPGPAIFRTATFRYCNWLQHWFQWPIVQIGPDLKLMILDK